MKKKKSLAIVAAAAICIGIFSGCSGGSEERASESVPEPDKVIYVSPSGSDTEGDGSAASPFATIQRAKEEVRNVKSKDGVAVEIADGFYQLSETLTFDENDSGTEKAPVIYRAAEGAHPIISGGEIFEGDWEIATEVDWLPEGLTAYKARLERDKKLRAIYVNGVRASMTRRSATPKYSTGFYFITAGQADWAWISSTNDLKTGNVFPASFNLPVDTPNPENIELESGSTWVKATVCAESLELTDDGDTKVNFQMPYAAIAQNLGWNTNYNPEGKNDVVNVFEWLDSEGQFYFDQAGSTLYYIPREGEDINTAQVVIPELEKLIEISGSEPMKKYAENIIFDGLTFAYSDWNLYELDGSHGNATTQGCTVYTKFSDIMWHNDLYRAFDVAPAAVHLSSARNVDFINGGFESTGYLGIHLENDVNDCDVTGNFIGYTGGAGIVIGHLQHIYENDTEKQRVSETSAGPDKEKFPFGTESVPKNITVKNNYLLENCYFFPGNSPITSFFTYNLTVEHNFIYKCSYSGMSIGWGWCNFDGTDGAQLPGQPTTTSRFNHVNYNRVEEICSVLQDAGGIYTLGQQGNEDWSEKTEMTYNYINCFRKPTAANGSRMVNGFHPDEGSAFIEFDHNVVTNTIRNVYELNDWMRKHDCIVTNGFSNTDRSETTAPNCTLEQYVNADYIWPVEGYEVVLYSGLEDEYVGMVSKDVMPDDYYELASNVSIACSDMLPRRGLLSADDTVWLAPSGTTEFSESGTVTCAKGNEKSIKIPDEPGEYKLYIEYADGRISNESTFTVYAGDTGSGANVRDGASYTVSNQKPLVIKIKEGYTAKLDGENISDGYEIDGSRAGEHELTLAGPGGEEKISFTAEVTAANRLLPDNMSVSPGAEIVLSETLPEGYTLWIAPSGLSAFDKNDPAQSCLEADGKKNTVNAPEQEGEYIMTVTDPDGKIDSQSDAHLEVKG